MTWLVVGASGQLGRVICEELQVRKIKHHEWTRSSGSISDDKFVQHFVHQIKPDVIINAAAWTDVDGAESHETEANQVNATAVGYLATAAKNVGAIFAHISTDYVFSGNATIPWTEENPKCPTSAYGRSKANGEDLALKIYAEGTYIFRTAWLYSEYGKNFAKTMVRLALKDSKPVRVVFDQTGQPTSAKDLANQVIGCVQNKLPFGVYHATNSGEASWFEFAQQIFEYCKEDLTRVIPVSSAEFSRPAIRPKYSVLSHGTWSKSGVEIMQNWKVALSEAMPAIIKSVRMEG